LEMELELDTTSRALYRLEKQEEEGANSSSLLLQSSHIHDISVDEKVFEDQLSNSSNSCSPTPKKIVLVTPLKRGPSASSTPTRGGGVGSIREELQEIVEAGGGATSELPSPLCEKWVEPRVKLPPLLQQELTRWQEATRRAILEEVEPSASGKLTSALNRAMEAVRRELVVRLHQQAGEEEEERELEQLRTEVGRLRAQLADQEERGLEPRRLIDVEMIEARIADFAGLLQVRGIQDNQF